MWQRRSAAPPTQHPGVTKVQENYANEDKRLSQRVALTGLRGSAAELFVLSLSRAGLGAAVQWPLRRSPPPGVPHSLADHRGWGERPGAPGPGPESQPKPTRIPALGNARRATLEIIRVTNY